MAPAKELPVLPINVLNMELENWQSDWANEYKPCAQHDSGQANWSTEPRRKLTRCCGQDRPHPPSPFTVQSTTQPL